MTTKNFPFIKSKLCALLSKPFKLRDTFTGLSIPNLTDFQPPKSAFLAKSKFVG